MKKLAIIPVIAAMAMGLTACDNEPRPAPQPPTGEPVEPVEIDPRDECPREDGLPCN